MPKLHVMVMDKLLSGCGGEEYTQLLWYLNYSWGDDWKFGKGILRTSY
jgi:hypothetical protein